MLIGVGSDSELENAVKEQIVLVPDFPKPGILFQDLCPLFANPKLMRMIVRSVSAGYGNRFNKVLAVESRGFVLGAYVAAEAEVPLILARKKGKLPGRLLSTAYSLEYGTEVLEMQETAVHSSDRVLVVDDVLATGGTLAAAAELVKLAGADTVGHAVIVVIDGLGGLDRLAPQPVYAALSVG